jgi:hypothetical protein
MEQPITALSLLSKVLGFGELRFDFLRLLCRFLLFTSKVLACQNSELGTVQIFDITRG